MIGKIPSWWEEVIGVFVVISPVELENFVPRQVEGPDVFLFPVTTSDSF